MKTFGKLPLFASFFMLVGAPAVAQTGGTTSSNNHGGDRLKMVIVLSRHGVRSPTWTADRLNAYSALPWPDWNVPPGYLTSRGFELVRLLGSYDRAAFAETGLVAAEGCADAARTYIWADTDQRTLESGRALAAGMFPGCPPAVDSLPAGETDPLFHPASTNAKRAHLFTTAGDTDAGAMRRTTPQQNELLEEMNHVLLGCAARGACTPVHVPSTPLLRHGHAAATEGANGGTGAEDALALASTFAEDFLLEYAEGMPASEIGWGHVDELQLRRFLQLHSDNFDLMYRTPALARNEASNMLFRIARTLEQGAEQHPVTGALGPVNTRVVILAGHDTNIAAIAALLGLHWTLDGRTDDTPPGMQLAFELWQDKSGAWSVRVTVAMQTLSQLRAVQRLTPDAPPAHEDLLLTGCSTQAHACALQDFERNADAAIGKNAASPGQPNSPLN